MQARAGMRQVVVSPPAEQAGGEGQGVPSVSTQFVFKMCWGTFHRFCVFVCRLPRLAPVKHLYVPHPHHTLGSQQWPAVAQAGFLPVYGDYDKYRGIRGSRASTTETL